MKKKSIIVCFLIPLFSYCHELSDEYYTLAQQCQKKDDYQKALCYMKEAVRLNPTNVQQCFELANLYVACSGYENALQEYKKIEQSIAPCAALYYNMAFCLKSFGQPQQALDYYVKTLQLNPNHSDAKQGLSQALLTLGFYEQAWPLFENRWSCPRPDSAAFTAYAHTHNDFKGKIIVLKAEFGLGDTIQFIRFAQVLKQKGATVIAQVQPQLIPLIRLCPYIDSIIATDTPLPPHDMETVLMSLPWACKTTVDTIPNNIPYIFADSTITNEWSHKIAGDTKFKIGICWHGNVYTTHQLQKLVQEKSIPLVLLQPLAAMPEVNMYSLQKIGGLDQLKQIPFKITHFEHLDEKNGPFMDTASLIMTMDLIITIDTSIAHLAGALGKKVWLLLPYNADWRWMQERTDSPWYPTMTLFRQKKLGQWDTVISDVTRALHAIISPQKKELPESLFNNGVKAYGDGNLQTALTNFTSLLEQKPNDVSVMYNTAGIQRRLNNLPQAIELYSKVLKLNPAHGDASFGLAQAHLALGNNEQGWSLFNAWRPTVVKSLPTLEVIAHKTVLITAEWGLGDMLHFIRYVQELKIHAATVIVQADKRLIPLLNLCPYIDKTIAVGTPLPKVDFTIPLLCLPTMFATTNKTIPHNIPYLKADNTLIQQWSPIAAKPGLKVGICWDIGHHDTNFVAWQRSLDLALLAPLATIPDVQLYSLQYQGSGDIKRVKQSLSIIEFDNFDTNHGGFMDTAAIMHHLDVVITVDTSIAHLAGGLGIPTWTLLPYSPDYRWTLQGQTTPWYPTMKLFRQQKPGDWATVIEQIKKSLIALVHMKKAKKHAVVFEPMEMGLLDKLYDRSVLCK